MNNLDYSNYQIKYNFNYLQYKKTLNRKNNFSFTLIFLIIILLLGFCVYLAPKPKSTNNFYYVEIDNFQTYKEAINLSNQLQKSGCLGFIYFATSYHVLVSFYSSFENAEKVSENLKNDYKNTKVFSINFPLFNEKKNLTNNQNLSVKKVMATTKKVILELESLANDFDTQKVTHNEAKILTKNYIDEYSSAYEDFLVNFKTNSKHNKVKNYLQNILNSLNSLEEKEEHEFGILIRYEIINISISFTQISATI